MLYFVLAFSQDLFISAVVVLLKFSYLKNNDCVNESEGPNNLACLLTGQIDHSKLITLKLQEIGSYVALSTH